MTFICRLRGRGPKTIYAPLSHVDTAAHRKGVPPPDRPERDASVWGANAPHLDGGVGPAGTSRSQQVQEAAAVKTGEDLLTAGQARKGTPEGAAQGEALFFHQPVQLVHDLAQGAPAVHQAPLGVDHAPAQGSRLLAVSQLLHIPQIDGLPIDGYAVPAQGFELDPVSPELGGRSGTAAETGGREQAP